MIIQNNELYEDGVHDPTFPFWGSDLNADAGNNILMRCMIRTRTGGSNIDGQRLRIQARELGDTYAEFSVTMGLGNATAAIFTNNDLNNATAAATIAGWSTISNTEGYQGIDIQNGNGTRYYYSQWDYGSQTVNDLYERAKWIQRNASTKFTLNTTISAGAYTEIVLTENIPTDFPATNGRIRLELDNGTYREVTYSSYTDATFTVSDTLPSQATAGVNVVLSFNRLTLDTALSGAETQIIVDEPIPTTSALFASSGTLKVQLDDGTTQDVAYSSYTGSTFTISDNLGVASIGNDIYISYNQIHGIAGELFRGITTEWNFDGQGVTNFQENEILSWGTGLTAGTGLLLALYDETDGAALDSGTHWIQLLTGVAPTNDLTITGDTSTATAAVNLTVTSRTVSPSFIGQSTGSALIGAFGIGVDPNDLTSSDLIFDLTNTSQTPPNFVTFTVSSLIETEDQVLVGPRENTSAQVLWQNQLSAVGNVASDTAFEVTAAGGDNPSIPSDTPSTGNIRAWDGNSFMRLQYSSYTGNTFTLAAGLPLPVSASANVFISYIDAITPTGVGNVLTFTSIYSGSDRFLFVRVRDGGGGAKNNTPIRTFETPATLGSAGGSVSAIRQDDF